MTTFKKSVVLIGGNLSSGGGANRIVRDLSTIFSEHLGFHTTVLSSTAKEPSYAFSPRVEIEVQPRLGSRLGVFSVLRQVSKRSPDFMVGFWHYDNVRLALHARLSGQSVILTEHTSWHHPPLRTRLQRRLTYKWARSVCVLNPMELSHYRNYLRNVVLLPNPISETAALPFRKERLIIAVGHLIARKGFDQAIRAMAKSGLAAAGWKLVIIGDGPERAPLNLLIEEEALTAAVHIEAPTKQISSWYARASLMLVTSDIEVFSLVLAEAMCAEVVPVAYAADGPAYLLEQHSHLLVPIGDVAALAARLRSVAEAADRDALGASVRESILARFSEKVITDQWRTLLGALSTSPERMQ